MKQKLLLLSILLVTFQIFPQIQLKFITVNQYGNNLYLDNLFVGKQLNTDIGVTSINNINPDTSYAIGQAAFVVAPNVSIQNVGKLDVNTPFSVTMTAAPGGYSSTKNISSLIKGGVENVTFDNLTITPGQPLNLVVTVNLAGDQNLSNNIFNQYTVYFPGVNRTLLFEEWTSSTCGPCAANNPTIDAFIASRFDSLVAIKYHMNWPAPGNDPMYLYNSAQANDRRYYYGVSGVPHVIMDGVVNPSYPYSDAGSLPNAYYPRNNVGTPLKVTVTNTRIPGDSIQADITVQVFSSLKAGNYFLRVNAVERTVRYANAPGTNGEKVFFDVFRKAYPNSLGTPIQTTVGTYNFTIKYPIDMAVWNDTLIYTAAYVQNDLTKEVLNAGHSRHVVFDKVTTPNVVSNVSKKEIAPDEILLAPKHIKTPNPKSVEDIFQYELFEGSFPAPGWSVINPDGGITFDKFTGANGPSLGGNSCVTLQFYDYSNTGRSDTLYSKVFNGIGFTDTLTFDYAYAQYQTEQDRLIVKLSADGGITFPLTIFDKAGSLLATAPATTNSFVPTANQWVTFAYPIGQFAPVELSSFTAKVNFNNVELNWLTATEKNNYGFEVQKKLGDTFKTIGFVKGAGTSESINAYSFSEKNLPVGSYSYRLKQVDFNGVSEFSDQVAVEIKGPAQFLLKQNYPNPFNPSTKINFNLPENSFVRLTIYSVLGEEIACLINQNLVSGNHLVNFDASNLQSGVYFYKLEAAASNGAHFSNVKKMILVK